MDIKMREWVFNIEKGPSINDLVDARKALQPTQGGSIKRAPINFDIAMTYNAPRTLGCNYTKMVARDFAPTRIEFDESSSHDFIIEGEAVADILHFNPPYDMKHHRFKARYNAATRQGTISFILY